MNFPNTLALAASFVLASFMSVADTSPGSLAQIPLKTLEGKETSLGSQTAKVLLVVNVASQCGLTPQYTALEKIHRKYQNQGFTVVGIPCNDFRGQEPGTAKEIREFCTSKYDVTFPLMEKVHVQGPEQHPLYAALTGKDAAFPGPIEWNFGKFLVRKDGKVLKRFSPRTVPDAPEVLTAIEAALAEK